MNAKSPPQSWNILIILVEDNHAENDFEFLRMIVGDSVREYYVDRAKVPAWVVKYHGVEMEEEKESLPPYFEWPPPAMYFVREVFALAELK